GERRYYLPASLLTPLLQQVLEAFFRREHRFFLSGGAALAGFHLAHRRTHDLDLFTTADVIEEGEEALALTADELGATVEKIQTTRSEEHTSELQSHLNLVCRL